MKGSKKAGLVVLAIAFAIAVIAVPLQYGEYDRRDLPNTMRIKAEAGSGNHIHAMAVYSPMNRVFLLCTGVFGEGLRYESDMYADISPNGVTVPIKKKWFGVCGYRFDFMAITCDKSPTRTVHDGLSESVSIGILDTSGNPYGSGGTGIRSGNRISEDALTIRMSGSKGYYWGCASECGNADNFGLTSANRQLSINCKDSAVTEPDAGKE